MLEAKVLRPQVIHPRTLAALSFQKPSRTPVAEACTTGMTLATRVRALHAAPQPLNTIHH